MQVREKVGKSRNTVFFQCFVAREGRKVGSLKRRVRTHLGRWDVKNCTPLWREAHFEVKSGKTRHARSTFGSWVVEKVHAVVARSTFGSQNVAKHVSVGALLEVEMWKKCTPLWREAHFKSKVAKHVGFGRLLEVEMWKKCTPLWREAHLEVKMYKTRQLYRPLLEVEMLKKCTPLWREAHFEVESGKTPGVRTTFGRCDARKSARRCGAKHIFK